MSRTALLVPLLLLLGIAITGIWMRHVMKTDIVGIKEVAVGLATFSPVKTVLDLLRDEHQPG